MDPWHVPTNIKKRVSSKELCYEGHATFLQISMHAAFVSRAFVIKIARHPLSRLSSITMFRLHTTYSTLLLLLRMHPAFVVFLYRRVVLLPRFPSTRSLVPDVAPRQQHFVHHLISTQYLIIIVILSSEIYGRAQTNDN